MRTWSLLSLALALALVPALLAGSDRSRADEVPPSFVETTDLPGSNTIAAAHIVVRFKPGVSDTMATGVHSARGANAVEKQPRSGLHHVAVPDGSSVEQMLATYRANPLVAEARAGHVATILDTPSDTNYLYQWHMHNSEGGMWADLAWNLAPNRGANVTVAVIDSGVAFEDYNTSLNGYPQTFEKATDLAGTTFVAPWDFNQNDAHPNDDNGHGTHVAGTIAQNTNNSFGVAGVAYNARIMPIKVLDYTGNGFDDDIVEGIYHAVANGADVINMSIGFPGSGGGAVPCSEIAGLNAALDFAHAQGVVLVAAAGNDGGIVSCPAAHPNVIAVGAAGYDGLATWYSNNGAALDISAPGGDPLADLSGDGNVDGVLQESFCYDANTLLILNRYDTFCNVFNAGTSMASPHVAGTAALLLGENAALTPDDVRGFLEGTARERGPAGWDPNYGWGALDSAGALASMLGVPKPAPTPVPGLDAPTNLTATPVSSNRINLAWTDNATAETGYRIERSTDGVSFAQIATLPANNTSYPSQNLPAATTFHYRVRASGAGIQSAYSNVAMATTQPAPATPTNLTATAVSSSRINLAWTDNATNEIGFKIERSFDGASFTQVGVVAANVQSFSHLNLAASTTHFYRVRAWDGPNHSPFSGITSATTHAPPAAPSNLASTAVSSSQINLTWRDNATNEAGFKLERSTDGVNFTLTNTLPKNGIKFSVTGLAPATTYHFRLRAYDGPNHSAFSNVAFATTTAAPAAPSNLIATAVSSNRVNLAWADNSTNEGGFKLERSTDGVNFSQVATLTPNTTSFPHTGLTSSTTYHFRIRAYEGANHSAFSNVPTATTHATPAAPSNLAATTASSSKVNLTWTDNASGETGFKIERSTDGTTFSQFVILLANTTSFQATNLSAATTYHFRIRAYDGPNHSAYSNVPAATTQPAPSAPSDLTATPSAGKITLDWTDNATNELAFKLERSTDGVTFSQIAIVSANSTSFQNTGLTSGVTYFYRIRAYDGPNHSPFSNVASATVP
jgi:subtilisin family serine protease